jgi:arsenate reductase (thioredoxin)
MKWITREPSKIDDMMNARKRTWAIKQGFVFICLLTSALARGQSLPTKTILFVCEHGSAKSIVAASHFSRAAKAAGLNVRVISRGTKPDKAIPPKINQLLAEDGLERYTDAPQKLSTDDLKNADYVVTFCAIPEDLGKSQNLETWNVPSFEAGYPAARDSILLNTERIIQKIKSGTEK